MLMLFIVNAQADIEYVETEESKATSMEIAQNRACFGELANQGCGDPGEDIKRFRSCLHDSFAQLTANCQKMMSHLYGKR